MSNVVSCFVPQTKHTKQIETGFRLLKRTRGIKARIRHIPYDENVYPTVHMVMAEIEGVRMAFDMLDGYNLNRKALEGFLKSVDFYFKRSFSAKLNQEIKGGEKIRPLGLNYYIEYPFLKERLKKLLLRPFHLAGMGQYKKVFPNDVFQAPVYKEGNVNILFITRLWNPEECADALLKSERKSINAVRLELCKRLKEKYPDSVCGLMDSPLAREMAPDLVLPKTLTRKRNYIKVMHRSDICIATTGLHRSTGWRFAEYVAASKVVLSEPLYYEVPYGFSESENYFEFTTVEECMQTVDRLVHDPGLMNRIKTNNAAYYDKYMRPDRLVGNALAECGIAL